MNYEMKNYSNFKFMAVVDWIELEIQTATPTKFWRIRKAIKELPFVTPCDPVTGDAFPRCFSNTPTTLFRTRVQDPYCWLDVIKKSKEIAENFPLAAIPKVIAIEIAFDAYSKGASREELAELTARFHKYQTHPVSGNRRFSGRWKGDVEGLTAFDRTRRMISQGRVINIGNKTDIQSQRIYFKTTDKGKLLPDFQHRARIEVTLKKVLPPVQIFSECTKMSFESYSRFFQFRTLKDGLDPITRIAAERTDQIGERKQRWRAKKDRTGYSGDRLYSVATQADVALNNYARYALRELSRRWQSNTHEIPTGRYRSSIKKDETQSTGEDIACGNTGKDSAKTPINKRIEQHLLITTQNNIIFSQLTSSAIHHPTPPLHQRNHLEGLRF